MGFPFGLPIVILHFMAIRLIKIYAVKYFLDERYFSDFGGDTYVSREEAEAASWLLPNLNHKAVESPDENPGQILFSEIDPYLNLDYGPLDSKIEAQAQNSSGTEGAVPIQSKSVEDPQLNDHCLDSDVRGSKPFAYGYNAHCLSHCVSSSSLDVGVLPDASAMTEISNQNGRGTESTHQTEQLSSEGREARVVRYREKRKMRPRIKGR